MEVAVSVAMVTVTEGMISVPKSVAKVNAFYVVALPPGDNVVEATIAPSPKKTARPGVNGPIFDPAE